MVALRSFIGAAFDEDYEFEEEGQTERYDFSGSPGDGGGARLDASAGRNSLAPSASRTAHLPVELRVDAADAAQEDLALVVAVVAPSRSGRRHRM